MQHHKTSSSRRAQQPGAHRGTLTGTVRLLWPYIWPADRADLKLRVFLAVALMLLSKLITIAIPYSFKWATDALAGKLALDAVPLPHILIGAAALTPLYGLLRILMALTQQGRDALFAAVAMNAVRRLAHRGVRALASPVVALSSGAQDRRAHAGSRARPQRDRDDHPHLDADRRPDGRRVRPDRRGDARSRSTGAMWRRSA